VGFGKYSQNSNIPTLMLMEIDEELVIGLAKSLWKLMNKFVMLGLKVYE
jgi:hypothetical protein